MVFMILLFVIKWLFQSNVAERESTDTSKNFKEIPCYFLCSQGIRSWFVLVGWAKAAESFEPITMFASPSACHNEAVWDGLITHRGPIPLRSQ
jgi:hypothetical protein